MIEERLSDAERRRLLLLVVAAIPRGSGDAELTRLVGLLSGFDTEVVVRRAYPVRESAGQPSARIKSA
jgi:hypothetical protein